MYVYTRSGEKEPIKFVQNAEKVFYILSPMNRIKTESYIRKNTMSVLNVVIKMKKRIKTTINQILMLGVNYDC